MGNSKSCCLKASASASGSPKLGRGSRRVKSKRESEAHEAAARDTGAVETVPAAPKSASTSGAPKRHHLKTISAPVTPQGKRQQFPPALWGTSVLRCPQSPLGGTHCLGLLPAGASFPRDGHLVPAPAAFPLAAGCVPLYSLSSKVGF